MTAPLTTSATRTPLSLEHNLLPDAFVWLWAKYVTGYNPDRHCTNVLRGKYSKALSKHNALLAATPRLELNEQPAGAFVGVYICGVAKHGYATKTNYPHNLHAVIRPQDGRNDSFSFERWTLYVRNGAFEPVPPLEALSLEDRQRAVEFTTCRIFRWAVVSKPTLLLSAANAAR